MRPSRGASAERRRRFPARVIDRFPHGAPKVAYLGTLAPHGRIEIEDPYGLSEAAFVETYERIKVCVDRLAV